MREKVRASHPGETAHTCVLRRVTGSPNNANWMDIPGELHQTRKGRTAPTFWFSAKLFERQQWRILTGRPGWGYRSMGCYYIYIRVWMLKYVSLVLPASRDKKRSRNTKQSVVLWRTAF